MQPKVATMMVMTKAGANVRRSQTAKLLMVGMCYEPKGS